MSQSPARFFRPYATPHPESQREKVTRAHHWNFLRWVLFPLAWACELTPSFPTSHFLVFWQLYNARRMCKNGCAGWDVTHYDGVGTDTGTVSDSDFAEDCRPTPHLYSVA